MKVLFQQLMTDNTFWALVCLVLFILLMVVVKVPAWIGRNLDHRAHRISNELEEARRLREEAQQLLAAYQRKRFEAEKEAENIISAARREARAIMAEAREKTGEYVERRNKMAEQKIARAEADAVDIVRSSAVDLAIAAAGKIIGDEVSQDKSDDLFKLSLQEVKARLN